MWGEAWDRTTSKAESLKVGGGVQRGGVARKEGVCGWVVGSGWKGGSLECG